MPRLLLFLGLALTVGAACGSDGGPPPEPGAGKTAEKKEPAAAKKNPAAGKAKAEAEPWFVNEAAERGIDMLNRTGVPLKKETIMGSVGPGAAVFDANGDGRLDAYVPNGNWLVGPQREQFYEGADRPRNALYIQQPDGTFRDEAAARGVDDDAWSFGSCAADLDNDGDQDLIVTNLGPNRLYVNDGSGKFQDIAVAAGVAGVPTRGKWEWSTGIGCGDYDRDGRLDVYISNYSDLFAWMRTDSRIKRSPDGAIVKANVCLWQRLEVYCGPQGIPGQQDHLYRNAGGKDGELVFEDVTKPAGIWRTEKDGGPLYGFQVVFADVNLDGWPDIYIANDSVPSYFFENNGDGTFRERAGEYGISVGMNGEDMAGMGVEIADINGDGWPDVLKTNFALETNNIYISEPFGGKMAFRDFSVRAGVKQKVFTDLGWAVLCFDYDHDGDCDLLFSNGHVYPEVDRPEARALNTSFAQYNKVFRNDSRGGKLRFSEIHRELGPGLAVKKASRGASLWDFDEDGDLDILVVNLNSTPDLLVNRRGSRSGHWIMFKLVGNVKKKTTLEAIGTKLKVRVGERTHHLETKRGQGFLGCHDPRVHVGLGDHTGPITVEVTWPNGDQETRTVEQVDRVVEIRQG